MTSSIDSARREQANLVVRSMLRALLLPSLVLALAASDVAASQSPYIFVGRQSDLLDQPYVEVELFNAEGVGIGPYGSGFDIYPYNRILLDTGANSALIVSSAAADLYNYGYQTEGFFYEQGVAGFSELHVSAAYGMQVRGTDGTSVYVPRTDDQVRILSNKDLHLGDYPAVYGGFTGLIGMPAMVDRVTTLDMTGWFDLTDIYEMPPLGVSFPANGSTPVLPPDNGHRYSVAVDTRYVYHPEEGLDPGAGPDAPLPVWAPIPFLTGKAEYRNQEGVTKTVTGDFLFDTGAQISLLTREMAFALGLDEDGDGTFTQENFGTLAVGGIGGVVEAEMLLIHKLALPTVQGIDLVWAPVDLEEEGGLMVLVLPADATQLPFNILGADFLTGGVSMDIDWITLEVILEGEPHFEQIQLDFRELATQGTGMIHFDLNPTIDQVIYPPTSNIPGDANGDLHVDGEDAAVLATYWGQSVLGGAAQGDFNGDGVVNAADAAIMAANYGYVPAVPGDANGDGHVDDEDAAVLAAYWGQSVLDGASHGDFNGDGLVNATDAAIMAANWSPAASESAATIPEPGTPTLLLLAAALTWPRRRR